MKKHKITNRLFALAMCLCMIFTMLPMAAHATETDHTHVWGEWKPKGNGAHYRDCTVSTCGERETENCYGGTATCKYKANCGICDTAYGDYDLNNHQTPNGYGDPIDGNTHRIICLGCDHVFVESEAHTFGDWSEEVDNQESRYCSRCLYTEYRTIETHTHDYSDATCTTPATCTDPTCGDTTGGVDKNNHTGGTEIRNAKDATETEDGYTGDTYCKGCGDKLSDGETIPATGGGDDDDDTHTHSWKIRQRNETYHEEYCPGCGETGMQGMHTYGDDGICTACGHAQHNHSWEYRIVNESRHETYCPGCGETGLQGMHTYGDDGICTACGHAQHNHNWEYRIVNESRHEPYCPGCGETGLQGMHTWKYVPYGLNSHRGVCTVCQYESSEKILHENNNGDDCWCDICGAGIHNWIYKRGYNDTHHWDYECDVCGEKDSFEEHALDPFHFCGGCNVYFHNFSNATCTTPATCSCGELTGGVDPTNHTGGTEIRNAKEATDNEKGYTGDTYCLGCGSMIASGKEIPAKVGVVVKIADDADVLEVTFITAEGVTLPDDTEVIVEDHTATIEPIVGLVGENANTEYVSLDDEDIEITEPLTFTYDGVTYILDEIVEIDGTEYIVSSITTSVSLMRLTDGVVFEFNRYSGTMQKFSTGTYKKMSSKLSINGVTYDVVAAFNPYEISEDKLDTDRLTYWVLYYDGKPAGRYFPNQGWATFDENYAPATLKAQQDNIFIGSVTVPEKDKGLKTRAELVADLEAAQQAYDEYVRLNFDFSPKLAMAKSKAEQALAEYDAMAQLAANKKYNVYEIGANDISVINATAVSGTITQTFEVPAELVGNMYVKYVAYHGLVEGYELGKTFLSEDGKTITATYAVDSFSPFIIYALVEADEPEIKTLSATIVDGSDDTTEAPDTSEPVESPQTSDNTVWYILIAVVAGAIVVVSVVYGKRRKNKAN